MMEFAAGENIMAQINLTTNGTRIFPPSVDSILTHKFNS